MYKPIEDFKAIRRTFSRVAIVKIWEVVLKRFMVEDPGNHGILIRDFEKWRRGTNKQSTTNLFGKMGKCRML